MYKSEMALVRLILSREIATGSCLFIDGKEVIEDYVPVRDSGETKTCC